MAVATNQPNINQQDLAAKSGLRGGIAQSNNSLKEVLSKQEKIKINVPRPSHIKKGMHYTEQVMINGYPFLIPTGVFCTVPEEVYLILVRAGKLQPLREEDMCELPAIVTQDGPEYQQMASGGAGSISNPINII